MEGIRAYQTAFRFNPELLARMKNRARLNHQSLNAYVEEVIQKDLDRQDRYEALAGRLRGMTIPDDTEGIGLPFQPLGIVISEEETAADGRLAHIMRRDG